MQRSVQASKIAINAAERVNRCVCVHSEHSMIDVPESVANLVSGIRQLGAVQFGEFKLKSGALSPLYVDLRQLTSAPALLHTAACALWQARLQCTATLEASIDAVVGVPYTGLPLATAVSLHASVPMIVKRKETKAYGLGRELEGDVQPGMNVLIVEDLATSGSSVLEVAHSLRAAGLNVVGAVVLIDREQGAYSLLAQHSIPLASCMNVSHVLENAVQAGDVTQQKADDIKAWLRGSQIGKHIQAKEEEQQQQKRQMEQAGYSRQLTFSARAAKTAQNSIAKSLFELMVRKQSNLCVAADAHSAEDVLSIADKAGPHVCCVKTHADAVRDFGRAEGDRLLELARKHDFFVFEDRKFADVGAISREQFLQGPTAISNWASLVTVHALPGPGVIEGISEACDQQTQGCVVLAEMSSDGALTDAQYAEQALSLASAHPEAVAGVVCQSAFELKRKASALTADGFVYFTPGVRFQSGAGELKQEYNTPEDAVSNRLADIAIVGTGIKKASDVAAAAEDYRQAAWNAYLRSLQLQQ